MPDRKEVRNVHGRIYLDVVRHPDGTLGAVNGHTYQFNQERGLVVIDSPALGLVAVVPVGMTVISSVNLTPEVGADLRKGDEFGSPATLPLRGSARRGDRRGATDESSPARHSRSARA